MGALLFYTAIYFIGYFAAHFFNQITRRMVFPNRRVAGLALTLLVGAVHGYKIISTSPPHDHGNETIYALGLYIVLPIMIIGAAVWYFAWQEQRHGDLRDDDSP